MKRSNGSAAVVSVADATGATRSKSELKRRRIVDAAARVFAERGYQGATLAEIAELAGTQAGSLYYHFDSREHLVDEMLRLALSLVTERVQEAIAALPDGATALDRIRAGVVAHLVPMLEGNDYSGAYNKITNQLPEVLRRATEQREQKYADMWQRLITDGQRRGELRRDIDPTVFRLLLFGAITRSSEWFNPDGRLTAEQITDELLKIFIDGAGGRARH